MNRNPIKTVSISDILNKDQTLKRGKFISEYDEDSSSLDYEKSTHDLLRTISQNTLSSTHRIFEYCEKSETCGLNLNKKLIEQDKRLENIDNGLDKINQNISDVENNLNSLKEKGFMSMLMFLLEVLGECCCCCFCWCCTKSPDEDEEEETSSYQDSISAKNSKPLNLGIFTRIKARLRRKKSLKKSKSVLFSSASSKLNESNPVISDDSFLSNRFDSKLKIKNLYDHSVKPDVSFTSLSIRQTSFDKSIMECKSLIFNNLKHIDNKLDSLQTIASGIGNELLKQNSKIDLHAKKAEAFNNKVENANKLGKIILKKENSTSEKFNKFRLKILP
jgi:hypothetical protein